MKIKYRATLIFAILFFSTGLSLLAVNLTGLFLDIRPQNIEAEYLRFNNDQEYSYQQTLSNIEWQDQDDALNYSERLTDTIAKGMAHINWNDYETHKFNQLIPIWDNYFLYFMGKFSGIPEYERYHFADYQKSLYRGIGICGDASMVMSQLLGKQQIQNRIISFPGHVVVETLVKPNTFYTHDADFGVVLPYSVVEIHENPGVIISYYQAKGYSTREIQNLMLAYRLPYQTWSGVTHFITKKYYFEKITYFLKWPVPIVLLIVGLILFRQYRRFPVR